MENTTTNSLLKIKDGIGQRRTQEQRPEELAGKLSSKRDWYDFFIQHL